MDKDIDRNLAKEKAKEFLTKLEKEGLNIAYAYIFGSLITGNFTEWSDVDIAVVSRDLTGDPVDDRVKLMKLRWDIDLRIEPHPFLPEEWDDTNPFVYEIKKYGERII